jgi:hypothetical protein
MACLFNANREWPQENLPLMQRMQYGSVTMSDNCGPAPLTLESPPVSKDSPLATSHMQRIKRKDPDLTRPHWGKLVTGYQMSGPCFIS